MKPRKPIGNLTLIGLLAVIVVIDIRTATLLPALHGAKVGTIEGDWNCLDRSRNRLRQVCQRRNDNHNDAPNPNRADAPSAAVISAFGEKISMTTLPLIFNHGHLFVELEENLWLFDTGAPTSFGAFESLRIAGEQFSLCSTYFGLTASTLSQYVGVECSGLLGTDVLGRFDHILDTAGGRLTVSTTELSHDSQSVRLDEFMGIPIVTTGVGGSDYRMFFDTGAQISYFQEDSLAEFPSAGIITDFYPGVGQFQTDTHEVPITLGDISFLLRCGCLPGLLGATLMMADTQGIIGNQVLIDRIVAFFPRRGILCL